MPTWYLRTHPEDIAPDVILVGDPSRIEIIREYLQCVRTVGKHREYLVVTGSYKGKPLTVTASGMGAPAWAVAVEELVSAGARKLVRVGTVMGVAADLGTLVLAQGSCRLEGTGDSYAPPFLPALPDPQLYAAFRETLQKQGANWREGLVASVDGFYSQMRPQNEREQMPKAIPVSFLRTWGVLGMDMETSTLYIVARFLGVSAVSLCATTVTVGTPDFITLSEADRQALERRLVCHALDALYNAGGST
jgi:uridine phosphorylase